jgi:hypothetical protein
MKKAHQLILDLIKKGAVLKSGVLSTPYVWLEDRIVFIVPHDVIENMMQEDLLVTVEDPIRQNTEWKLSIKAQATFAPEPQTKEQVIALTLAKDDQRGRYLEEVDRIVDDIKTMIETSDSPVVMSKRWMHETAEDAVLMSSYTDTTELCVVVLTHSAFPTAALIRSKAFNKGNCKDGTTPFPFMWAASCAMLAEVMERMHEVGLYSLLRKRKSDMKPAKKESKR